MRYTDPRLNALYKKAVHDGLEQTGGDQAYIALVDDSELIQIKYAAGDENEKFLVLRVNEGVAGFVVRTGEPYFCSDAEHDLHFLSPSNSKVKQEVAVPLIIEGKTFGLLLVDSYDVGKLSSDSARILQDIARDFVDEARSLLLNRIGKSSLQFQALCQAVVDEALESVSGDQAYIAIVDDFERLNIEYSLGDDLERFLVFSVSDGTAGAAIRDQKTYFCRDVSTDPHYVMSSTQVKQEIVVPLIVDDQPQGVLLVNSFKKGVLSDEAALVLEKLAQRFVEGLKGLESDYDSLALLRRVALERHFGRKERDIIISQGGLLEPSSKCVTVLFADIRNFSSISSMLAARPHLISSFLSKFYQRMSDAVHDNGGAVDKFIGDGVMAIFGGLDGQSDDNHGAQLAIAAAREMRAAFRELREPFLAEVAHETGITLESTFGWGCALHTSHVLFGFLKTRDRLDLTAIGEGVNVASRIEDSFKDWEIRISQSTKSRLDQSIPTKELGVMTDNSGKQYRIFGLADEAEVGEML